MTENVLTERITKPNANYYWIRRSSCRYWTFWIQSLLQMESGWRSMCLNGTIHHSHKLWQYCLVLGITYWNENLLSFNTGLCEKTMEIGLYPQLDDHSGIIIISRLVVPSFRKSTPTLRISVPSCCLKQCIRFYSSSGWPHGFSHFSGSTWEEGWYLLFLQIHVYLKPGGSWNLLDRNLALQFDKSWTIFYSLAIEYHVYDCNHCNLP